MPVHYSKQQKEMTRKVRDLLTELLTDASAANADPEQLTMLKETLSALEDSFLVVVVGEFNAGKSSFINALLNTDKLAEGVTPTTALINLIRYGENESSEPIDTWGQLVRLPAPMLESMSFVDTPGTNAVIQEHEVLTRWFLPRADMVLFISSTDRPFSESENQFLHSIQEWGKKTLVILNKIDLLPNKDEREQVVCFVRDNVHTRLNSDIPVLPVSSRLAKQARSEISQELWKESGYEALEKYIQEKMDERSRFTIKMQSALGIAAKAEADASERIENELAFYQEDRKLSDSIQAQLKLYRTDMEKEINRSMNEIHGIFTEIRENGHDYFEKLFVIKNIPNLMKKDRNQVLFQTSVLQNLPIEIERKTTEIVENIAEQQQRMVEYIRLQVENRNTRFSNSQLPAQTMEERAELLKRMQSAIDQMLEKIRSDIAMDIGMKHAQSAITAGLAIEVSAIGLGAALTAVATTAAMDLLGIVAAFWVGVAGFLVLPYYKKKAQKEFDEKITDIESKLIGSLREEFNTEIDTRINDMNNAVRPFERFVEASLENAQKRLDKFAALRGQIESYRQKLQ